MKFSVIELLNAGSHKWKLTDVDDVTQRNLADLCRKINALGYQPPMYASSCLRSLEDQKRINPSALGSSHLYGCAVDISDPDGKLKSWLIANKNKLIECGLWMESPNATPTWCHLSSQMPKSGKRIFIP